MSVDSLSVVSNEIGTNHQFIDSMKPSIASDFKQIKEVETDEELSNDEYDSQSQISLSQTPLHNQKLKTRKGELEVKPQDLKKKNDCLFFEFFS